MKFCVSKNKFIKNELLISIIILTIIYFLEIIYNKHSDIFILPNPAAYIFMFMYIFIYKKRKYYDDLLYISESNVKLERVIRYGKRRYGRYIKEEYRMEKVNEFKENKKEFILYGNVEMHRKKVRVKVTEIDKKLNKLVIRKNFQNENEIRNQLTRIINNQKSSEKLSYNDIKYYRIKNELTKEEIIFMIDIDNVWFYLDKKGQWKKVGGWEDRFKEQREKFEEVSKELIDNKINSINDKVSNYK